MLWYCWGTRYLTPASIVLMIYKVVAMRVQKKTLNIFSKWLFELQKTNISLFLLINFECIVQAEFKLLKSSWNFPKKGGQIWPIDAINIHVERVKFLLRCVHCSVRPPFLSHLCFLLSRRGRVEIPSLAKHNCGWTCHSSTLLSTILQFLFLWRKICPKSLVIIIKPHCR